MRFHLTLLGLAGVHAGKFGASSPRRFVLLHGSGTSAGAFVVSPTAAGAKGFLSGVPRRTDAGSTAPPNWLYEPLDSGSADGCWWQDGYKGAEASLAAVEEAVAEFGAAGVIGHEQGATLAAVVAARSALGLTPPLKFAVCCGAAMPTHQPWVDLLQRLRDSPDASIPSLHCIGTTDPDAPACEELAACFGSAAEILTHDNGSGMPPASWWEETQGYPERVTGGRYWVTQHRGPFTYASPDGTTLKPGRMATNL